MPGDIQSALNGMTYVSTSASYMDIINITLYDGAGGLCLDNSQLGSSSVRVGCLVTTVSLRVNVLGYAGMAAGGGTAAAASASAGLAVLTTMPMQVNVVGGVLGAVVLLLSLRCCCQRICCCFKKSDSKDSKNSNENKNGRGEDTENGDCDETMGDQTRSRPIR